MDTDIEMDMVTDMGHGHDTGMVTDMDMDTDMNMNIKSVIITIGYPIAPI
jgi:hypothetical protein